MARTGRARKHTHPIPKVETNNTTAGNVAEHIVHARTGDTTHQENTTHTRKHPIRVLTDG